MIRRALTALLALGALAGVAHVGWIRVLDSPYFYLDQLDFEETPHLSVARLREELGVGEDAHYFRFDPKEAEAALLQHPWVRSASVEVTLPDKLKVRVDEVTPAGILVLERLFLVDAEGLSFAEATARDAVGLPIVTGVSEAEFREDQRAAQARVVEALALTRLYRQHPLSKARPLSNVHAAPGGRFELQLGQTRVQLGRGDFEAKLHRLAALFEDLEGQKMDAMYILLSDDLKRAIVRRKPEQRQMDLDALPPRED